MKINVTETMRQALVRKLAGTGDPDLVEFLDRLNPPKTAPQMTAAELTATLGAVQRRHTDISQILDRDRGRPAGELKALLGELLSADRKLQIMLARQLERDAS